MDVDDDAITVDVEEPSSSRTKRKAKATGKRKRKEKSRGKGKGRATDVDDNEDSVRSEGEATDGGNGTDEVEEPKGKRGGKKPRLTAAEEAERDAKRKRELALLKQRRGSWIDFHSDKYTPVSSDSEKRWTPRGRVMGLPTPDFTEGMSYDDMLWWAPAHPAAVSSCLICTY